MLVHRRCQNPMFDVSNTIAYAGQMVHAVGPRKPGPIGAALGESRWVDVNGDAESKWSPAEGEAVVGMLAALAAAGVQEPDVFIITPFKVVEQEMHRRLDREAGLLRTLGVTVYEWPQVGGTTAHEPGEFHQFLTDIDNATVVGRRFHAAGIVKFQERLWDR